MMKSGWDRPPLAADPEEPFGPRSRDVRAIVERARRLTREELESLDAEVVHPSAQHTAWQLLRDRCRGREAAAWSMAAQRGAWDAVAEAAASSGGPRVPCFDEAHDGGYWLVDPSPGFRAARAAVFAACAVAVGGLLEEDARDVLERPWRALVGPAWAMSEADGSER